MMGPLGERVQSSMMEEEVDDVVGPKGRHKLRRPVAGERRLPGESAVGLRGRGVPPPPAAPRQARVRMQSICTAALLNRCWKAIDSLQ